MSEEKKPDNLARWKRVSRPPERALKAIAAGRLKGKTDINPQWRMEVMTAEYGECGVGWYYDVERFWVEPGANSEVMAFVHIKLYTKQDQGWSAPIVGIGGSAIVAKESGGLHANDEGFKMATTDALSVAMKQLGVAADIYMGLWDGSKYKLPENFRDVEGKIHKPANNEQFKPSPEEETYLLSVVDAVVACKDDYPAAAAYLEHEKLDPDEKVWVWNKLGAYSALRSGIKKHNEALKAKETK